MASINNYSPVDVAYLEEGFLKVVDMKNDKDEKWCRSKQFDKQTRRVVSLQPKISNSVHEHITTGWT